MFNKNKKISTEIISSYKSKFYAQSSFILQRRGYSGNRALAATYLYAYVRQNWHSCILRTTQMFIGQSTLAKCKQLCNHYILTQHANELIKIKRDNFTKLFCKQYFGAYQWG